MAFHYNAFISYRHHPEDIKVAEQIQRSLERYKLPRSLKKATGGIRRLFRDKDELSITSNLSDEISMALRNSDYLIVICSTHTQESTWVQREIELFIATHDREHVLTVLVDGEPYDVIPQCLLKEDRINPRTGETEEISLEPLSCDWRDSRRKIRAQELARLAAPLLGCSYDELRRRKQHYQMQQRMAAASAALARHLKWGDEKSFWAFEFNYQSAIHHKMRKFCEIPGTDLPEEKVSPEVRHNLEVLEHRRWNAYMRSEGYVYSGSTDKSSRNDLAKLHNDLVPFDMLSSAEQKKDFVGKLKV